MRASRFRSRLFALSGVWLLAVPCLAGSFPSFEDVRSRAAGSEARLLDRNGDVLQEQRRDLQLRQLGWTPLAEISPALRQAVLLSEDRRFLQHHGVDWLALLRAAGGHLLGRDRRGASTISMQLAALLDPGLQARHRRKAWTQKLRQIYEAIELEQGWAKEGILEAYLNLVSFRGELRGVAAAARGLFGKAPSGLSQEESLVLAALLRAPQAAGEKVRERACRLGEAAHWTGACDRVAALVRGSGLLPRPFPPEVALAPQLARRLLAAKKDRTTVVRRLQAGVLEILRRQVLSLKDRNVNDAAALVIENATGQVLAYVGSIGELSSAREVDGVLARRQAGSTLKPFLYSLAFERRYLTAASRIDDSVTNISLGAGAVYRPQDFDKEYHGDDVTARLALASSLNIPAVRTLQLVGVGSLVDRLGALGFQGLRSEEYYGPSLALGTADITLWELVNAYRTLANRGLYSEPSLTLPAPAPVFRRVIDEGATFVVSDILSDRTSRSLTFGLDSPMALPFWTAAKTGTSKDMRDNWCIGYSSRYTVGVWAGNFDGAPMWNVTGVSGAAPAWAEIMELLHQPGRDRTPVAPHGVVRLAGEWYLRGTEPAASSDAAAPPRAAARIVYPVEGLTIARDPDIPPERQRVVFEASRPDRALHWVLNEVELGAALGGYAWRPGAPGEYELKLVSQGGEVMDRVKFVVRR